MKAQNFMFGDQSVPCYELKPGKWMERQNTHFCEVRRDIFGDFMKGDFRMTLLKIGAEMCSFLWQTFSRTSGKHKFSNTLPHLGTTLSYFEFLRE